MVFQEKGFLQYYNKLGTALKVESRAVRLESRAVKLESRAVRLESRARRPGSRVEQGESSLQSEAVLRIDDSEKLGVTAWLPFIYMLSYLLR